MIAPALCLCLWLAFLLGTGFGWLPTPGYWLAALCAVVAFAQTVKAVRHPAEGAR